MMPALMIDLAKGRRTGTTTGAKTAAPTPIARPVTMLPPLNRSSNRDIWPAPLVHENRRVERHPVSGSSPRGDPSGLTPCPPSVLGFSDTRNNVNVVGCNVTGRGHPMHHRTDTLSRTQAP